MSCGCGKQQSRNVSRLQAQLAEAREHVKRLELTVTLLDEEVGGAAARLASLAEVGLKRKRELDAARAAVDVLVAWVQEGDGCCLDWGEREEHHGACPVGNLPEAVRKRQVQLEEAREDAEILRERFKIESLYSQSLKEENERLRKVLEKVLPWAEAYDGLGEWPSEEPFTLEADLDAAHVVLEGA